MPTDLDIINAVVQHRLRQDDLDEMLAPLDAGAREQFRTKIQELLDRMSVLIEVSNSHAGALSLYALLPRVAETVSTVLDCEDTLMLVNDTRTGELFSPRPRGENDVRFANDRGITGTVYQNPENLIVIDAGAHPRFDTAADQRAGINARSMLITPIRNQDGELIGVCRSTNKAHGAFDDEDIRMQEALMTQASASVENSLIFESFKKSRREEAQMLELTNALSSDLQLDTLLAKIMGAVTEILDADRSTIFLHDTKTDELFSRIAAGLGSNEIRIPSSAGIAGNVFTTGETINIPDAYADPRFNQEVDKKTGYKTNTILCMPIINKQGQRIGVTQVLNKVGGAFTSEDEKRLQGLSSQVSIALENAKLFESVLNMKNYNDSILKSMSSGVMTLDEDRKIIKLNEAGQKILSVTEDDVLEKPVEAVFKDKNIWVIECIEKVERTGEADLAFDTELHLPDGEGCSINLTCVPLVDPSANSLGFMMVIEDISSEKRLKSTMGRYMSKEVMDQLLEGGESVLGGNAQEATVLFSDIRSFTTISEQLGPKGTVTMLNEYFEVMVEVLMRNHGILDKFIGDAIMAIFGAPLPTDNDPLNAVTAANEMMVALRDLNQRRIVEGMRMINIGVGLSTGELVAGNIGSSKRMDYTVIGDTVNLAARLEGVTKFYGAPIVVSEFTRDHCGNAGKRFRRLDLIRVKGKNKPVEVLEALDHHDDNSFPHMEDALGHFEEGVDLYRARSFDQGAEAFQAALKCYGNDTPSKLYLKRCHEYMDRQPPDNWDGVHVMTSK